MTRLHQSTVPLVLIWRHTSYIAQSCLTSPLKTPLFAHCSDAYLKIWLGNSQTHRLKHLTTIFFFKLRYCVLFSIHYSLFFSYSWKAFSSQIRFLQCPSKRQLRWASRRGHSEWFVLAFDIHQTRSNRFKPRVFFSYRELENFQSKMKQLTN